MTAPATPQPQREYVIREEHLINYRRGTITFGDIEDYARYHPISQCATGDCTGCEKNGNGCPTPSPHPSEPDEKDNIIKNLKAICKAQNEKLLALTEIRILYEQLEKMQPEHDAATARASMLAHNKSLMNLELIMDAFLTDALDPEYIIRERLHIEIEESLRKSTPAQEQRP